MKILIVLLSCVCILTADKIDLKSIAKLTEEDFLIPETRAELRDTIEDTINGLIECIRQLILEGNSTIGLPPLDPFELENINVPLDFDIISGDLSMSNLRVDGIATFRANVTTSLGIIPPRYSIKLQLQLDNLLLKTDYSMDLKFLVTNLNGDGQISIGLNGLEIDLGINVYLLGTPTLRESTFSLNLESSNIKITGFSNDELLSKIISKQLESTLKAIIDEQSSLISNIAGSLIDDLTKNITLSDLTSGDGLAILNC